MKSNNQKQEHHKIIIDGNAFYEIDLDCMHEKEEKRKHKKNQERRQRR